LQPLACAQAATWGETPDGLPPLMHPTTAQAATASQASCSENFFCFFAFLSVLFNLLASLRSENPVIQALKMYGNGKLMLTQTLCYYKGVLHKADLFLSTSTSLNIDLLSINLDNKAEMALVSRQLPQLLM